MLYEEKELLQLNVELAECLAKELSDRSDQNIERDASGEWCVK